MVVGSSTTKSDKTGNTLHRIGHRMRLDAALLPTVYAFVANTLKMLLNKLIVDESTNSRCFIGKLRELLLDLKLRYLFRRE
jgi:hypothetical protein